LRHCLELPTSLLQASSRLSLQVLIHSYSYSKALPPKNVLKKMFLMVIQVKIPF
jgi:hypothetical protein